MSSPSSTNASNSKSFLWTFPECPVRIHVNFQFIDRLQQDIQESAPAYREVGGLLIAAESPVNGDIEISGHIPLPERSDANRNFTICSDWLTKMIQALPRNCRVIGFYRTHLEPRINLRAADLECIQSKFNHPGNIFLLIRPHDGRNSAGFFFWNEGAVVGGLTFPFSRAELSSPYWSTLMGGSSQEDRPQKPPHKFLEGARSKALGTALQVSNRLKIGFVILVVLLIAAAGAMRILRQTPETPSTLGLHVERALLGVVVAWNPAAPDIVTAKEGNLLIWDGTSPAEFVRLSAAQLRTGRAFFTSISDKVEVRLDVLGPAGSARTESFVSTSQTPDSGAPANSKPAPAGADSVPMPAAIRQPAAVVAGNRSGQTSGEAARAVAPVAAQPQPALKSNSPLAELSKPAGTAAARGEELLIPPVLHTLDSRPPTPAPPEITTRPETPQRREPEQTAEAKQLTVIFDVPQRPTPVVEDRPVIAQNQQRPPAPEPAQRPPVPEPQLKPAVAEPQPRAAAEPQRPPAAETQPQITAEPAQRQTVAPVAQKPVVSSFQAAVPIRQIQPTIPAPVRPVIHSDNVIEVRVRISAAGNVTEAKIGSVSGTVAGLLAQPAVSAALGWKFRPATQNGAPVASEKVLEFRFRPPRP